MVRILTATIIIVLLLAALLAPARIFALAVLLVVLLAWSEYARLAAALGTAPVSAPGALAAMACALAFASSWPEAPLVTLLGTGLLVALAALRDHFRDPAGLVRCLAATLVGIAWLGLLLGAQIGIRNGAQGAVWLLLLYASVAVGDSAAYYGGRAFGKRRLAAELSPSKTVAGSLFGLAGSAAAALFVAQWVALALPAAAILGIVLGLLGQVGDLLESALKRAAGSKDSSGLLPGHGGVLDRIDAHLLAGGGLWLLLRGGWLV